MDAVAVVLLLLVLVAWRMYLRGQHKQLQLAQEQYESLFEHNVDAVVAVDAKGTVDRVNAAFAKLSGYEAEELEGAFFPSLISSPDRGRVLAVLQRATRGEPKAFETVLQQKQGGQVEMELLTIPILVGDRVVGAYEIARDIRMRKEFERELENRALHDYLTGLPNRALFQDRLEHALQRVGRQGRKVALLYFDLDKFKEVNDTAGHAVGDSLLCSVASRLRCFLRDGDTVARLGGDEFAILIEDVDEGAEAVGAGERLIELFEAPFRLDGKELECGVSVGAAVSSTDAGDPEELVRRADLAMYESKRKGGNCFQLYVPELEAPEASPEQVKTDLDLAIEREELTLHYQPIVELAGTWIVGVEALIRWQHAERGLVHPAGFLPVAEDSGVILNMERWVLRQGCRQVRRWMERGLIQRRPFYLSLNLSGRYLAQENVVQELATILEEEAFSPAWLQLEISEGVVSRSVEKIAALKSLGVKVAIDDFGTGESPLRYLMGLKVDVLKIDRSFVFGLGGDQASSTIVRTILALAEMLNLEVIVEGIEEPLQLARLQELGGRLVQGFYFGAPVDAEAFERLLRDGLPPSWAWKPGSPTPGAATRGGRRSATERGSASAGEPRPIPWRGAGPA